ncbi:sulfatase-like hydrolase/transferase [Alicyclobacillus fastidiosus]|uniref:Sulfatase-like hydrolase/transferase n=1 Tax=Alicyclobacillus fastidiosus TaxID=392011 RepID=A0ABY6ZI61_9BACL|nr:sulfatase [Alicyclobacillus fastidiosus]WAH42445.1 sulfatase-like hydrolase/transferase [Alicyclobacillus fastidiosus]GMA64272.1 sulfatase [Alicyclobacillus fastidiosus]
MRIVYIDIDSLRPDHMGCYGYVRKTTPNIDIIAAQGVRFTHTYCEASPCVPSRASFISGKFAINHGSLTHFGSGGRFYHPGAERYSVRYPFFTRYLREAGYKTVTISSFGDRHQAWWFFAGWNEIHSHTLKCGNEDADEVNAHVIPWIMQHGAEENYFLHVQYWDPHGFYTAPDAYAEQFVDQPAPTFPSEEVIQNHRRLYHPRSASMFHWAITPNIPRKMPHEIRNRADYQQLINGYDAGISYMDEHVGQILDAYRKLGIEDEVCFVISADHGESFGEQGIYMEHGMATESVHRIPLIMRIPGVTLPNSVFDNFVYNVDVVATIVDLVGLDIPTGWDGQSLLPLINKPDADWNRDYLVLEHGLYACQRAVCAPRWYFIRTYDPGFYKFDPVVLYDMENDPNQCVNVASENPAIVAEMDHLIADWVQENRSKHGEIMDPMEEIIRTGPYRYISKEAWLSRLREVGKGWAADEFASRTHSEYQ